jgi:hypothetical protein
MSDSDRADRLSSRRKNRSSEQEKPGQPEQPAEQEESQSIKDQYKGKYMYLPEALGNEFDLVADELDTRRRRHNGKQVEKIRHFEPLVVALGLEQIDELDQEELEDRLAEFDP